MYRTALERTLHCALLACRVLDEDGSDQQQTERAAQQQGQQEQLRLHVARPLLMQRTDTEQARARTLCLDSIGGIWQSDAELEAALRPYTPYLQVGICLCRPHPEPSVACSPGAQ